MFGRIRFSLILAVTCGVIMSTSVFADHGKQLHGGDCAVEGNNGGCCHGSACEVGNCEEGCCESGVCDPGCCEEGCGCCEVGCEEGGCCGGGQQHGGGDSGVCAVDVTDANGTEVGHGARP